MSCVVGEGRKEKEGKKEEKLEVEKRNRAARRGQIGFDCSRERMKATRRSVALSKLASIIF